MQRKKAKDSNLNWKAMPGTSVLVTEIEIHRLKDCEVLDLTISTLPNAASVLVDVCQL